MGKNLETAIFFLATFRQYLEFHIRMVKCLLHSRMRKRVGKFEIVFETYFRKGAVDKSEFEDTIGGAKKTDDAEEEKIDITTKKRKYDESEYTIGGD